MSDIRERGHLALKHFATDSIFPGGCTAWVDTPNIWKASGPGLVLSRHHG